MPAPIGNSFAMKFKTAEERQGLCKNYCEHVEKGFSDRSFPDCDMDTIERYMLDFPEDFPTDKVEQARRKRMLFWEQIGIAGTIGKLKGFNARSWIFNMGNRFGWRERNDITTNEEKLESPILYIPYEEDSNS